LVILLLDITDPILTLRIKLTEGIKLLRDLEIPRDNIIIVFNKVDLAPERANIIEEEFDIDRISLPWIVVSALERTKLEELLGIITSRLKAKLETPMITEVEEKVSPLGEK
jgi:50S ribosomal subunit-associated GTPase HflX